MALPVDVAVYETADGILFLRDGLSDWVFEVNPNTSYNDACRAVHNSQPPYRVPRGMKAWGFAEKSSLLGTRVIATWHGIDDVELHSHNKPGENAIHFLLL